ncbi:MAG: ATP-binding cassette domain-containing protein [Butyrivibrio sp.]|nr:ATP-binding cassette domain-containing protein [Butyrivibrio sp.]
MIKKRLIELLADAVKFIKEQVVWKVLSLISQIVIVICISNILSDVVTSSSLIISGNQVDISAKAYIKYIIPAIICIGLRFFFDKKESESAFMASADVKSILRQKIYSKLLSLGSSYREKVSTGEITQLMTDGVDQLETYFGLYLSQLFYAMISPVILFIVVTFISFKAAIILLIFVPLIPISIVVVQKIAKRLLSKYWGMYATLGDSFLDNIQGLTTLKIYQSDKEAADKMDAEAERFRNITMKVLTMQLNSTSVMDIMAYGGAAVGIIIALSEYSKSHISLAGALIIVLLAAEFFLPMRRLGSYFHVAMNGMAASDKIFALLDLKEPEKGTEEFPEGAGTITFDKVFFSYDKDCKLEETDTTDTSLSPSGNPDDIGLINRQKEKNAVLKGVSMEISKGSFTAIAGVSGSGKSTIASLLIGRQKSYSGSLKIGDVEVSTIKEDELFKNITLVSSGAFLFKGTIRENLAIAGENLSDEKKLEALKKVNLTALNESALKDQSDTTDQVFDENNITDKEVKNNSDAKKVTNESILDYHLTEGASNISGGQRQRLAIARALLHETNIYIFDEATSNIDAESEEIILNTIKEIAKDHTVIMITHRLANAQDADKIIMLKDGVIAESGTHKELMGHFGSYSLLYNAQQKLENYNGGKCKTDEMPVHKSGAQQSSKVIAANTNDEGAAAKVITKEELSTAEEKRRSAISLMLKLIVLIKPLLPVMLLAITLGVLGFICAIFLTIKAAIILKGSTAIAGGTSVITFTKAAAWTLVIMAVLRGLLHYGEQYCNHFIAFKLLAIIRHNVFKALRKLSPAKLEGHDKGNIIAILTSDIELLEVFYAHTISPVVIAAIMTIIMVVFEWTIYPIAGIIALFSYIAVGIVIPVISSKRGAQIGMKYRQRFGDLNSYALESMRGLDETIQFGNGESRQKEIKDRSTSLTAIQKVLSGYQGDTSAITGVTIQIATWIMLLAGLIAGANDFENISKTMVAVVAIMSSFGPVIALSNLSNNLNQTLASAERVISLLEEAPVVKENTSGQKLYPKVENIYTENLSFAYEGEPVLNDLTIGFPTGRIIGIHGPSGCGKSTLLKLLMRFWDADSGSVRMIASETDPATLEKEKVDSQEEKADSSKKDGNTDSKENTVSENKISANNKTGNKTPSDNKSTSGNGSKSDTTTAEPESTDDTPKEPEPPKPMSAIEMLKAMQAAEKEKIRVQKERENAFLEKSRELARQKEEARKKAALEAEKIEKQKRMTLKERIDSLLPNAENKERSKDIKEVRTKSLRSLEAYVTQDTYIFHDTIAANIKVAKPSATMEEVEDAAKKASLHEFIMSLPNGYNTKVGELGDTLSGGERQRIGIARAFLNDADIVLLDEPTSNLDSLNEGIILKSLKETVGDKTIIIVSHRDSTMAVADNVYSFE